MRFSPQVAACTPTSSSISGIIMSCCQPQCDSVPRLQPARLHPLRSPESSCLAVSPNAIQSPGCSLHAYILFDLRNHHVLLVRCDKLDSSLITANHPLQIGLGST